MAKAAMRKKNGDSINDLKNTCTLLESNDNRGREALNYFLFEILLPKLFLKKHSEERFTFWFSA
jgi:hypothetical protein